MLRRLKRHQLNTAIYLLASVLSRAASILLIPLYTRRLTQAEYGSYGLAVTLFALLPPLMSGGLIAAFSRFFFDDREAGRRDATVGAIARAIAGLAFAAGAVVQLGLLLGPASMGGLGRGQLSMVVWTCVCVAVGEIPIVYFRASERALGAAALSLGQFLLTAGATAYLMLGLDLGVTGMLGGMLAGQGAGALFALAFVSRLRPQARPGLLREALGYSLPFIPHMIGNGLMISVDRWALEFYGRREDLGLYTLAAQLASPIGMVTSAWNEASSPRFLATWRDGGDTAARAALPRVALGFVAAGGVTLLAILVALPLLKVLIGAHFQPAFALVPWIGLSLLVGTLFSAFINVLFLRKNTRLIPVLTLSAVLVNAALNVVLVPRFGVYGAIAATGLAMGFRSSIMLLFAMRALRPGLTP